MTTDLLFDLYKKMKRISMVENAIAARYNGDIRPMHTPIHLYNGQEAVAVGVCSNLRKNDVIFSNHRSHGHYLAKGGNLKAMIAELYSKKTGCCHGKGGSMHLMDLENGIGLSSSIVAGNVPIATGYALSNKLKGNNDITCVFLGDGSSEEGGVYESICFSQIKEIPMLYICENNKYAINTPLSDREPCESISTKFNQIIRCEVVDGNNVEEVFDVVKAGVEYIRIQNKPVFIECLTYRQKDHSNTGNGVNGNVRTQEELDEWIKNDPIEQVEKKLLDEDIAYKESINQYILDVEREIEEAFTYAEQEELPKLEDMYANVY